jgi:hypothetical protein
VLGGRYKYLIADKGDSQTVGFVKPVRFNDPILARIETNAQTDSGSSCDNI